MQVGQDVHTTIEFLGIQICGKMTVIFFNFRECLLLDSAFTPADNFIPTCEKLRGQELTKEQTHFNYMLKRPRSRLEYCIGVLKGRFPFLKSIRFILEETEESMRKTLNYIITCAVLHNHLLSENESGDTFYEYDGCASDLDADDELDYPIGVGNTKDARRIQLTNYFAELML